MKKNLIKNVEANFSSRTRAQSEAEYNAANAFVKSHQAATKSKFGGNPRLPAEAMKTDAYMGNNGENASKIAMKLSSALDKMAFPVRK